jgi:hypothetical protein
LTAGISNGKGAKGDGNAVTVFVVEKSFVLAALTVLKSREHRRIVMEFAGGDAFGAGDQVVARQMAYNILAQTSCDSFGALIPEGNFQIAVEDVDSAGELLENESPDLRSGQLR